MGGVYAGAHLGRALQEPRDKSRRPGPIAWTRQLGAVPEVVFEVSVAGPRGCSTQTFTSRGPGPVCVTITDSRNNHLLSFLGIPPLGPAGACTHGTGVPGAATNSSVGIGARIRQSKDPRAAGTRSHWRCCHSWAHGFSPVGTQCCIENSVRLCPTCIFWLVRFTV